MAMCNFGKNKITYTMDKNFNGDVVSTTNIMLPIKLYLSDYLEYGRKLLQEQ